MLLMFIVRDCLFVSVMFGLLNLYIWWKNRKIVQEHVVVDEQGYEEHYDVNESSEITNDYNKLPDLNNIQQTMNVILEKSEDNMNEGDYLEVANNLKSFYTDVKKLESLVRGSVPLYIRQDVIVESHLDYYKDVSFKLSREELRTLMNGRIRERDRKMIVRVKEYLEECYIELKDIQRNKKFYWDGIKAMHTRGTMKYKLREQHKNFVEAEKKMNESIKRQRERLYNLEARVGHVV